MKDLLAERKREYRENGFSIIEGFLESREVRLLFEAFAAIVEAVSETGKRDFTAEEALEAYSKLRASNPWVAGTIYDTLTTSLPLQSVFTSNKTISVVESLLGIDSSRIAHFFRCMRLDPAGENPNELGWHQDFQDSNSPSADAYDGLTIWIPLTKVGPQHGSIEVCLGSHSARIESVRVQSSNVKNRSKSIHIDAEESDKFDKVVLELEAGDAVFMNMNVLHRSFPAPSGAPWRVTVLSRYFDLASESFIRGSQRFVPSMTA